MTTELSNPHDRFFKEVWSRKAIGRDFLRRYLPKDVVAMLDLKALELVKGSFVDPQLREYHSDLNGTNFSHNPLIPLFIRLPVLL